VLHVWPLTMRDFITVVTEMFNVVLFGANRADEEAAPPITRGSLPSVV
jgi:hypothetical protein